MALTPEKRKALTLAHERIANGLDNYICFALNAVARKHPSLETACEELKSYIARSLRLGTPGAAASLHHWQEHRGIYHMGLQIRADRLAWIDWMLGDEL